MLSKNFRSLLESMKSPYNEMDEDRDERIANREERRRERREDKFGVSTDSTTGVAGGIEGDTDFKIRPFSRAVQQLKAQVQSEIFSIDQTIKNREAGSQSASTFKAKFVQIAEIISRINSKLDLMKDKEGGNLEAGTEQNPKDLADIKLFRGLYSTAANDFLEAQKEWAEKKLEADNKYLSDLKDTETNNFLRASAKSFTEVQAMLNELIRNSQSVVGGTGATGGATGAANLATGETIKSGKYTKDSKEGKIVIEVKKTVYTKFKKYLGKTKDWGVVYKSGVDNVSGTLLANTQAVIRGVKAGLVDDYPKLKDDKTGDITPEFIDAINKVTESKENTSGRLITFENFIKSKVNEAFNQAAAETAMSGGGSSTKSKSSGKSSGKIPEDSASPFKNKEEGDKFRAWVNQKYPDWAKQNSLDATGPFNNGYIRKAYTQYGEEYGKSTSAPTVKKMDGKQMNALLSKVKEYTSKAQLQLTTGSGEPVIMYYSGKVYGHIYNNFRVSYVNTEGGNKTFMGTYNAEKEFVSFGKGKDFNLKSVVLCSITEKLVMTGEESDKVSKADELLAKMSEMIVAKFNDNSFWKPFKGTFNDSEQEAVIAFTKWYGAKLEDAYYNPALNRAKQLPTSKAKENLLKNFSDTSDRFQFDRLIKKLYGGTSNDTYKWTIYKSNGTTKTYSVDTDF
jgi:hypothetical protein